MANQLATKQQSTALTTASQEDLDAAILLAGEQLESYADTLSGELKEKVLTVAQLTRPGIAGVEGKQRTTVPFVQIRQPTSASAQMPENTKAGELWSADGAIGPKLVILPVLAHDIRKKWSDTEMDCQSMDGITGTKYGQCASCPHGRYEEGQRTPCSKGTAIWAVTEDISALYRIDFTKTSASAGKNILRLARPPALWARSFSITTEKKANAKGQGNYYEFKTGLTGDKTSAEVMKICELLHGFFKAVYERAKAGMAAAAARQAAIGGGGPAPGDIKPNADGVIDFSDGSM